MIWYKTNYNATQVEKVEVVKETSKFVYVKIYSDRDTVNRYAKENTYFPTFKEAKQYMIDFRLKLIERLKNDIAKIEEQIENVSLLENNND